MRKLKLFECYRFLLKVIVYILIFFVFVCILDVIILCIMLCSNCGILCIVLLGIVNNII